jgi:hypothetical protein
VQTIAYKGRKVEIVAVGSGFYCRWPEGSTHITGTMEAAVFLAERIIDMPEIYGEPKEEAFYWQ